VRDTVQRDIECNNTSPLPAAIANDNDKAAHAIVDDLVISFKAPFHLAHRIHSRIVPAALHGLLLDRPQHALAITLYTHCSQQPLALLCIKKGSGDIDNIAIVGSVKALSFNIFNLIVLD
jgi:hypothetical protein